MTDVYLDAGQFLGMGGQRYRVTADQIREVKPDGLVLTLTEADVKGTGERRERNSRHAADDDALTQLKQLGAQT